MAGLGQPGDLRVFGQGGADPGWHAQPQRPTVDHPGYALADADAERLDRRQAQLGVLGGAQDGGGQRVLAAGFQAGGQRQRLFAVVGGQGDDFGQLRAAFGEGAGFVHRQHGQPAGVLQRGGVAKQHAMAGAQADAHHHRRRGGQAQRARAGNHQHRHRLHDGAFPVAAAGPHRQQGGHGNGQHRRHKIPGNHVRQPLDRRFRALRLAHLADDGGQLGVGAHASGAQAQHALQIAGGGVHRAVHALADRGAFAGQQAFVHAALAVDHHAVHGRAFAFAHPHHLAHAHLGHRHILHCAVALHPRCGRRQLEQGFDGPGGLPARALFQPLAQQHQGDHQHAGFKVHMAMMRRGQRRPHAQQIGHAGAQRHQHIHIGAAAAQAEPGAAIKAPTHQKLHWRGQRPLPGHRQQAMAAGEHGQHFRHKRQRQQG